MWQRGVERGEIRPDVDKELFLDLIYGPMIYRLLVGHCPLDHTQAEAIIAAVFQGMKAILPKTVNEDNRNLSCQKTRYCRRGTPLHAKS